MGVGTRGLRVVVSSFQTLQLSLHSSLQLLSRCLLRSGIRHCVGGHREVALKRVLAPGQLLRVHAELCSESRQLRGELPSSRLCPLLELCRGTVYKGNYLLLFGPAHARGGVKR